MAGSPSEEPIAERVHEWVSGAARAPWEFSADDARRSAKRRPFLVAVAHRAATAVVTIAVVASIAVVLLVAGVFTVGLSSPAAPSRHVPDGTVAGYFWAVGGPLTKCGEQHPRHCSPGRNEVSGTVRLVPASGNGATYYTNAVDGRWRIQVPPGTYLPAGSEAYHVGPWTPSAGPVVVQSGRTDHNVIILMQVR
jgi:hypothetical protein